MVTPLPWFNHPFEADRALLSDDWWPYGIGADRKAIDVALRYHHEQGITYRRHRIEDIFAPELLTA